MHLDTEAYMAQRPPHLLQTALVTLQAQGYMSPAVQTMGRGPHSPSQRVQCCLIGNSSVPDTQNVVQNEDAQAPGEHEHLAPWTPCSTETDQSGGRPKQSPRQWPLSKNQCTHQYTLLEYFNIKVPRAQNCELTVTQPNYQYMVSFQYGLKK